MIAFRSPLTSLGSLDADAAATLIAAAADLALVMDSDGMIQDISITSDELNVALDACRGWIGRPWRDTVSMESRPKIEAMLLVAAQVAGAQDGAPRWRHVNHPAPDGIDVPVLYSAIKLGPGARIVAIGRDLRAMSNLQQRLVDAQQSMEQDYARLQHLELRYRLLFQTSREPVVIVDAVTHRVLEANPAAGRLLGETAKRMVSRPFAEAFATSTIGDVQSLLNAVRGSGRPDETLARLADDGREILVAAHVFRQDAQSLFLVRLSDPEPGDGTTRPADLERTNLLALVQHAPDAFIVTSADAKVLSVNTAFLDMAQLSHEEQAQGESLDRWLGRPGVDVDVLIANLKQRGSIRLFATTMHGEHGIKSDVEVSAVAVTHKGTPTYGFAVRNVARRLAPENGPAKALPRSVEQLTELIGRVPLKDLVRETTDVIERLCIEAALELTRDNRASAAEMLGLSRQSLYVKLRRFGIVDGEADADV